MYVCRSSPQITSLRAHATRVRRTVTLYTLRLSVNLYMYIHCALQSAGRTQHRARRLPEEAGDGHAPKAVASIVARLTARRLASKSKPLDGIGHDDPLFALFVQSTRVRISAHTPTSTAATHSYVSPSSIRARVICMPILACVFVGPTQCTKVERKREQRNDASSVGSNRVEETRRCALYFKLSMRLLRFCIHFPCPCPYIPPASPTTCIRRLHVALLSAFKLGSESEL